MCASSYSFMPILSLYRCFSHGLFVVWIILRLFFVKFELSHFYFYYQSEKIVGTLCAQLLLQFYIDSFEVFCTWSEDMCGLDIFLRLFFNTFSAS